MTRFAKLARRLALVLGLIGCGGVPMRGPGNSGGDDPAGPGPGGAAAGEGGAAAGTGGAPAEEAVTSPEELEAAIQQDLASIHALEVVRLAGLRIDAPANACYQYPCPNDLRDPAVEPQYRQLAPRLARLTDTLQTIAADPDIAPADPAGAYADMVALNQLHVVVVLDLWRVNPANNPNCYSLPCPADIARADAENRRRAGVLHAWAVQATAEQP
jgi:hypothetical protein